MQVQAIASSTYPEPEKALKKQKLIDQEIYAICFCKSMLKAYPQVEFLLGSCLEQAHGSSMKSYVNNLSIVSYMGDYGQTNDLYSFFEDGFSSLKKDLESNDGQIDDYLEYRAITKVYQDLKKYMEKEINKKDLATQAKLDFLSPYLPKVEKSFLSYHVKELEKHKEYFSKLESNVLELAYTVLESLDLELERQEQVIADKKYLAKQCSSIAAQALLNGPSCGTKLSIDKAQTILENPAEYSYYNKAVASKIVNKKKTSNEVKLEKPKENKSNIFTVFQSIFFGKYNQETSPSPSSDEEEDPIFDHLHIH